MGLTCWRSTNEQLRDFGVLRTGRAPNPLCRTVLAQAALIAGLGYLAGAAVAYGAQFLIADRLGDVTGDHPNHAGHDGRRHRRHGRPRITDPGAPCRADRSRHRLQTLTRSEDAHALPGVPSRRLGPAMCSVPQADTGRHVGRWRLTDITVDYGGGATAVTPAGRRPSVERGEVVLVVALRKDHRGCW
ncbi:hypothetical protein NIIDMKKI_74420 [Mycobacterium kansasii]|uniref:Uncharacterized protein n=1 Tax=Mycobacterium kansasii TaxID=1768 RepID=A0A7G1IMK4_MYCKA|nr:hypothetical protein NIIDMKKI_74420 [Mycobacterium kansasii]